MSVAQAADPRTELEIDAQAAEFLAAFDAFVQAVRRARGATAHAGDDSLSLSQYSLLLGLVGKDTARVQDLAADAGVAASTATRILDTLERRGVVERTRDQGDRRAVTVALTAHGSEMFARRQESIRARERSFYAGLPEHERELAPELLARLATFIEDLASGCDD